MAKKKIGIIGGGISGTALGYHLSLYDGEAEVIVFEKDTIGGASTAKSAGTVCLFDDSLKNRYWDVRLYGFESYLKMEAEEKGSAGFDKTGTLVVATNEEVEKVIKTGISLYGRRRIFRRNYDIEYIRKEVSEERRRGKDRC